MSAEAEMAKKAATDRTNHVSTLTEYQQGTFELLEQLRSRLSPVSNQADKPMEQTGPAIGSHLSYNVDYARTINNQLRNLIDDLEI
jgi:hypothetical protein